MEGKNNSRYTGTKRKILPTIKEDSSESTWGQNWEEFRNPTVNLDTSMNESVLIRLENEDVDDPNCTVGYLKHYYNKVTDPELIEYFKEEYDIGSGDGILTKTSSHQYIKKEGKIYRRKLFPHSDFKVEEESKDLNQKDFSLKPPTFSNDKNEQDLSQFGGSSLPKKIQPPLDWTKSVYSDIMSGVKTKSETPTKYIEASNLNKNLKKRSDHNYDLKLFNSKDLEEIELSIAEAKKPSFEKLKERYINNLTTFRVSNSQYVISKQVYDFEMEKPEKDRDETMVSAHLSLKSSITDQTTRLKDLEKKLEELAAKKSPYYISEITMPKFGNKDTFDMDAIKMFPLVGSSDDLSIKDLFEMLSSWAEDIGLSEKALKRVIFTRLRGERAKAWMTYQKQPLKEAITSLSLLFDKSESPQTFANEIKHFSKGPNEGIQNSVQRLIRSIDKYLENRPDHDKKVLRMELIKDKLDKLLSSRALKEVFRLIEEKHQLGEELGEKELLSKIYKEDFFDRRPETSSSCIRLQNININEAETDDNEMDNVCDIFENIEINGIEGKRPAESDPNNRFKMARTDDRNILTPRRTIPPNSFQAGRNLNPIVVGNRGSPLVRIGNPNPNNPWHNRQQGNQNSLQRGLPPRSRQEFLGSRNAPLQQQNQQFFQPTYRPQMRYNRDVEFDRRPWNTYNDTRPYYNRYTGPRGNYGNQQNSAYNQNPGNLKHNLQFRTNPPAIFQQISLEELNNVCVDCPKERGEHTMGQCPALKGKVFRKAPEKDRTE